jgi:hypothetical protein
VTLGNIISISHLLDLHEGLDEGLLKGEEAERQCAQADFLEFQDSFSRKFYLMIDGEKAHAQHDLFDPFILQLLVTIVKYKQIMRNTFDAAFTFKTIYNGSLKYLHTYHPHLESTFIQEMKKENKALPYIHSFEWLKPFTVIPGDYPDQDIGMESPNEDSDDVDKEGQSYILESS